MLPPGGCSACFSPSPATHHVIGALFALPSSSVAGMGVWRQLTLLYLSRISTSVTWEAFCLRVIHTVSFWM